jgi:hypothetical protein
MNGILSEFINYLATTLTDVRQALLSLLLFFCVCLSRANTLSSVVCASWHDIRRQKGMLRPLSSHIVGSFCFIQTITDKLTPLLMQSAGVGCYHATPSEALNGRFASSSLSQSPSPAIRALYSLGESSPSGILKSDLTVAVWSR